MNILFLTPYLPYPPNSGGKIRTLNLIKILSINHNVFLLSLIQQDEIEYISGLEKYCNVIPLRFTVKKYGRLKSIISKYPYVTMLKHYSYDNQKKIDHLINSSDFDIIQVESLYMSAYIEDIPHVPKILDAHNIESDILYRTCTGKFNIKSILNCIDYLKNKKYEQNAIKRFDACISVSEIDNERIRKMGAKKLMVLPNCADLNYFFPTKRSDFSLKILFTGFMNWYPNIDAIQNFYKEAYSIIKKQIPNIKLLIVGREPNDTILRLGENEDIIITGEVPDVRPFISNSDVCIVPLRIGGGTRLKILEYFAMEKPVISTSIGAEGIDVVNMKHLIVEDDISKFPDRIVELLNDPEYAGYLARNGRELVENKYSWQQYENKLNQLYLELIDDGSP